MVSQSVQTGAGAVHENVQLTDRFTGVVIARTSTSVFDYVTSALSEALRLFNAKRRIFQREFADSLHQQRRGLASRLTRLSKMRDEKTAWTASDVWSAMRDLASDDRGPEQRAIDEAATAARKAASRALVANSKAQEAARRAAASRLHLQLVRTVIAAFTTAVGLRCACDGSYPLAARLVPAGLPATPEVLAIYAPALVGAFEFSQGAQSECGSVADTAPRGLSTCGWATRTSDGWFVLVAPLLPVGALAPLTCGGLWFWFWFWSGGR